MVDVKKLDRKIVRFAKKVNSTVDMAISDPIHDHIYKEEMATYCVKAIDLLTECRSVFQSIPVNPVK
jgi:hypothetical protein